MHTRRRRSDLGKIKLSRRQVLRAGTRAGIGVATLTALGAGPRQTANAQSTTVAVGTDRGGTLTHPLVGPYSSAPHTLDPYRSSSFSTQILSGYHYSKLIQAISAGDGVESNNVAQYENDLAISMPEIPDESTYIFTLRPDAHWHDVYPLNGRRVTTEDIDQAQSRFRSVSPNAASWDKVVARFTTDDVSSIRFDLHEPYAPFLTLVGSSQHLWIVPPEIVDQGIVESHPVGSGPWIFESYESDVAINWRRNPDWHRSRDYVSNRISSGEGGYSGISGADAQLFPLADRVRATLSVHEEEIVSGLADGTIDYSQVKPESYREVRSASSQIEDDDLVYTLNNAPGGFFFNFSIPPWNDLRVRQALSLALDRDAILNAVDETGRGGWHGPIAQFAPYFLDPKNMGTFGAQFEGEDSGTLYHRDLAKARQLLDAAGYPGGLRATLHGTDAYGAEMVKLYEYCAFSAAEAGFDFELFFKDFSAYNQSIFRGNFPDDWDGESSHLAIGPLHGGGTDPNDILSTVYERSSSRHNWGSAGRTPEGAAGIASRDLSAYAANWSHVDAASGGSPDADERMQDMIQRQRTLLDYEERLAYVQDIQRYLSTKMYIVPYVALPSVYAFNPWMKQIDPRNGQVVSGVERRMRPKTTFGWGTETEPFLYVDSAAASEYNRRPSDSVAETPIVMSSTTPGGHSSWLSHEVVHASYVLSQLPGVSAIWKWSNGRWVAFGTDSKGRPAPGARDFEIRYGDVLYLSD